MFPVQGVVEVLSGLVASSQLHEGEISDAIDALEVIKNAIPIAEDDAIDKVDEIQDYLDYLLVADEPLHDEVKEEIANMIHSLQEGENS